MNTCSFLNKAVTHGSFAHILYPAALDPEPLGLGAWAEDEGSTYELYFIVRTALLL